MTTLAEPADTNSSHALRNVLFLTYGFHIGGAERFFVNTLNRLNTHNINPTVVSLAGPSPLEKELDSKIKIFRLPRRWRYDLKPVKGITSVIATSKIDTILALDFFSFFYAKLAARNVDRPVKILISFHTTRPRGLKEFASHAAYARMLSGTDKIVPVCENQKKYLQDMYLISEKHFTNVIYNGVDTRFWTPPPPSFDKKSERANWGIPEDGVVILNVARFQKEKRHDLMIKALAFLPNAICPESVYLVLVGGGNKEIESRTLGLARSLGLQERVVFTGAQSNIRSFYWIADLFTLASTSETFSIAALEAMSCDLPCVLTDVGGASEMIRDSRDGILVPPGAAKALAAGWSTCISSLRSKQPGRIREGVRERFELKKCVRQYEDLLLHGKARDS